MNKRGRLEIIYDILKIINSYRTVKFTPLLRKSNMSTLRFKEYLNELLEKEFIQETNLKKEKSFSLTPKGQKFLERYKTIVSFIEEFEL